MIEPYGTRLQAAMQLRGVSVAALAKAIGLTYQGVSRVIDGKSKAFTAANNEEAAHFLRVSPRWLATGKGQMEAGPGQLAPTWPLPFVTEADVRALSADQLTALGGAMALAVAQLKLGIQVSPQPAAPVQGAPSSPRGGLVDMDTADDPFPMRIDGLPPPPWEGGPTTAQLERRGHGLHISHAVDVGHVPDSGYSANDHEFLPVPELDVRLAAGQLGIENYQETEIGQILLRRSFLESFRLPIERMRIVYSHGDSMEPVIRNRNPMLMYIDPIDNLFRINPRFIYAINQGGTMIVKCIMRDRDGIWMAKSLNPVYRPFPLQAEDGREVRVIGHILWSPNDLRNGVDERLLA